ncbi:MAG: glucosaminidase domain-containing protein, partial [Oscillospiraceae bacterium]
DHSNLFLRLSRYQNLIGERDYKTACRKVQEDGYATAPTYSQALIDIIESYKLYRYDDFSEQKYIIIATSDEISATEADDILIKLTAMGFRKTEKREV